jgi:hypothetical protein
MDKKKVVFSKGKAKMVFSHRFFLRRGQSTVCFYSETFQMESEHRIGSVEVVSIDMRMPPCMPCWPILHQIRDDNGRLTFSCRVSQQ